ncbi:MAG: Asp-tRNA(Asn)/Glu-tRNA(Gln) amidotransferase subunit GatC [Rhodobacteraceae bacterium]|nr:Asp-tRNA(Asn)/Glu-tRNA(Gln) amidotransferase GatCAB subunit C [Paracoccaceae bacterium]RZO33895.1 MAG: Asp-tRNA(Asn)/Glu-tRNA(Gln) amidotransferase subunit GatC [Paracoccaceae bacterium]|tara:strand:+ start:88 stop:375 length:288 start_codon:yes stop_codon:yes gene_type:complete
MSIDKDTAARVANLARISIPDEELENVAKELSNIIGFMEQLNEVNVDNVEPMTSVTPTVLKKRTDVVNDGNQQSKVLSNAPDTREGFFAVPKVVD